MYARSPGLKAEIFAAIERELREFKGRPYTAFAHSLGGLIFTDFLRARGVGACTNLVTFGCNIGLFTLGSNFEPVPGLTDWLNIFDDDDILGYPLAQDPNLRHVRDVRVEVGMTGLAHTAYWGDYALWAKQIPAFLGYR